MATTRPANHLEQSQRRARQFLDTNNSLTSKVSDEMISLLEAGEGSFYLRDQLDNILNNIIHVGGNRTLWYDWTKLRQLMSIKDKIAYVTAVQHTRASIPRGNPINIIAEDDQIKETLNSVIDELDQRLINNQEFTESWILRHAAINRFSCNLDTKERAALNIFATKVKKLCSDEWFDILAEVVNFTFESDAQKIIKVNEVISQLSAMGVVIPDNILKEFSGSWERNKDGKLVDGFERHILKLKNLDKAYKHLTNTLHMVHETAKTTEKSMVTPKQQKQLEDVMDKCEVRNIVKDTISGFNKEDNIDQNNELWTPMRLLETVKNSSKFNEIVAEMGIENYFDAWFLSWVTFELTHGAHTLLNKKKSEAFGGDIKKYDEDCKSRRGMMRRRIFEVYDHNNTGESSDTWDFANDADFERMNSYYTKFPNLFFNSPQDNYNVVEWDNPADVCALHFDKMRSILAAIIRRRVPAMRSSDRIRRGSYPKMIVEWARHALKWDERGIFKWIERQIERADDASILAMTIMFQNEANNKLFYQEKDPFIPKEKRYSKIFKKISGAEKGRQAIRDKFAPAANVALKATETTVKWALWVTTRAAEKWAWMVNAPLEKINEWLSKQSAWNPMKLWMIATKPMQWLLNPLSKWIKYTDKEWKEQRISVKDALNKWYESGKEALPVREGEEKKTKYLFQWLTRGIGSVTEFFGKTVADSWQWMQDQYITASQRNVLWALFEAGQKEDRWNDLMRSSDIANMLDLKNIWPKLFDDDGRILPVDKPAEKYPEDKDGIKKLQKDIFGKQYDDVQSQIKLYFSDLRTKFDQLDKKLDAVGYWTPEYENIQKQLANLWIQMDTWKEESDSLNAILVAIQKVATGASTRGDFKDEIDAIVTSAKGKLDAGETTVKDNKEIIITCDTEIKKKEVEKAKIERELSLVHTGDEKTEDLKTQLWTKTTEESTLKWKKRDSFRKIKNHEDEISKIEEENKDIKSKIDKLIQKDEQNKENIKHDKKIESKTADLKQKESDRDTLHSIDFLIRESKVELEKIEKKIKWWSLSPDDQKELETQKSEIEEKIRDLETKQKNKNNLLNNLNREISDIKKDIKTLEDKKHNESKDDDFYQKEIEKLETQLRDNKDKIRQQKSDKEALELEFEDTNEKIAALDTEIKEIKEKIKAKWGVASSRLELNDTKTTLETEIKIEEEKKKDANKKIEKQEIKNRVLKKVHQWWVKVQENADILADFDDTTKYSDEQKRKLLKKTLENLDLSFEKKIETPTSSQQSTQQTASNLAGALA